MVREISEPALSRPNRSSSVLAAIGALALALPLAACGRKGPLDPPPGGYVLEQRQGQTPVTRTGAARSRRTKPAGIRRRRPADRSAGPKKKLPADWLID